jgi:hypothetical protein
MSTEHLSNFFLACSHDRNRQSTRPEFRVRIIGQCGEEGSRQRDGETTYSRA